jgi:hypothetical protein
MVNRAKMSVPAITTHTTPEQAPNLALQITDDENEEMTILEGPPPEPVSPKDTDGFTQDSICALKTKHSYPQPYTLAVIEAFETEYDIQFPPQLSQYLTDVSSHIYKTDQGLLPVTLDCSSLVTLYPIDFFGILYEPYDPQTCPQIDDSRLIKAYVVRKSLKSAYRHLVVVNRNNLMRLDTVIIDYGVGPHQYLSESFSEYIKADELCYPTDQYILKPLIKEEMIVKQSCCSQFSKLIMKPIYWICNPILGS